MAETLAETGRSKRPDAFGRLTFAAALVVATVWVLPECGLAQPRTVHIRESLGSVTFRAHLNAAFGKLKVPLAITRELHSADYVLQSYAVSRKDGRLKREESTHSPRQESAAVVVKLVDRCGDVAWSETGGELPELESRAVFVPRESDANPAITRVDVRMRMDRLLGGLTKSGSKKLANRIARRLRTAIRRGDVRVSPRTCP